MAFDCDARGSACGPVIVPVFKTGVDQARLGLGGFDSHSLPPFVSRRLRVSSTGRGIIQLPPNTFAAASYAC